MTARRAPAGRRAAALAVLFAALAAGGGAFASESLPPAPDRWVSDLAGVLSREAEADVDRRLEAFEREQGTQVLVAIFRRLPADVVLEDWTQRVAQSWRVGRAKQDDGAVLFVFVDDRELRLEVGYGLEGALTDLESKAILDEVLVPHLRQGDWDGGIRAAAEAIVASVRGEYAPTPHATPAGGAPSLGFLVLVVIFVTLLVVASARANRSGRWRSGGWGGGGLSGGGWGGGGFGGGFSGGGFSGGGGSFGGGGASSRW